MCVPTDTQTAVTHADTRLTHKSHCWVTSLSLTVMCGDVYVSLPAWLMGTWLFRLRHVLALGHHYRPSLAHSPSQPLAATAITVYITINKPLVCLGHRWCLIKSLESSVCFKSGLFLTACCFSCSVQVKWKRREADNWMSCSGVGRCFLLLWTCH